MPGHAGWRVAVNPSVPGLVLMAAGAPALAQTDPRMSIMKRLFQTGGAHEALSVTPWALMEKWGLGGGAGRCWRVSSN